MSGHSFFAATLIATISAGASASPFTAVERLFATAIETTSPARISVQAVDITITRWSTMAEHDVLKHALLGTGPAGLLDRLCTFAPAGAIELADGRQFTIRYARQGKGPDGARRVFVAVDEPIALEHLVRRVAREPLIFLELRLDRSGYGVGKFSEAERLSINETQNVIELTDYDSRPAQLLDVRSERPELE
jgi:hypothetical protein